MGRNLVHYNFMLALVVFHDLAYARNLDQSNVLTYLASSKQDSKVTMLNMTIQISASSEFHWPRDLLQIQAVKEEIVQLVTESLNLKERQTRLTSELSHAIDNRNNLKWKAIVAMDQDSARANIPLDIENNGWASLETSLQGYSLSTGHILKKIAIKKIGSSEGLSESKFSNSDAKSGCDAIKGKCQDDSLQCTGSYVVGKCSGPNNIKCCTNNITLQDTKICRNVPIYSRDSWGARRPISIEKLSLPVGMFFIHHTETSTCTSADTCAKMLRSIQRFHMDTRKWEDIAYSFLVGQDGRIYEGRGWQRVGSHTLHYNARSLAVSVIGNFNRTIPNAAALKAVRDLLECGTATKYLTSGYSLYGHRDVRDTECPGDAFYNLIRTWPHYNTTTDKDGPCLANHGICKPNYLPCSGSYKAGLCNGYRKRQCCIT